MNIKYFILAGIAAFSLGSCTTAYKAGQTPDDVYYSPARDGAAYVQMEKRDRYDGGRREMNYYGDPYMTGDDFYLRMMVRNRTRWSALDPYFFNGFYNPYNPAYYNNFWGSSFHNPWNNYWSWNSFYNPYMPPVFFQPVGPGFGGWAPGGNIGFRPVQRVTTVRAQPFNPYSYRQGYSNNNRPVPNNNDFKNGTNSVNSNGQPYNNSSFQNGNRYNNNNSSNRNQYRNNYERPTNTNPFGNQGTTPNRTYNPVNSGGSSGGGGGTTRPTGGGGVSRPGRGGN